MTTTGAGPGTGPLRAARALLLAVAVVALSLVSHDVAGGAAPGAVPLVVLTALAAVAVRPLTRREVGLPRLLSLLGLGQVVLHLVFERCAAMSPTAAPAPHGHDDPGQVLSMLGAHALATLVLAVVLRYGDACLWRLWSWLSGRRIPGRPRPVVVGAAVPLTSARLPSPRRAPVPGAVGGRAPPAVA
ncbi:hypothetical protein [Cellulosimicrobium sp. Marseille-Q8652]